MTDSKLQNDRLLAMAIDIGILIVLGVIAAIIHLIFSFVGRGIGSAIGGLISGVLIAAFMAARDIIFKGNSIGKHVMKLKVVDASTNGPITLIQSIKRNIFFVIPPALSAIFSLFSIIPFVGIITGIIDLLIGLAALVFFVIEVIKIVSTPDGIRIGDNLAGTKVIRAE